MKIEALDTGHFRIELPVALSDSTHGTITHFELITVRLRDSDGVEGVGYTYTVGSGGGAVHALIDRRSAPRRCWALRPSTSRRCGRRCGGVCTLAGAAVR